MECRRAGTRHSAVGEFAHYQGTLGWQAEP